ncbi:cyclophilin-like fold protein [Algoriphagus resistens]|uniref:cyclophilin-like fold protein n=1 Tax=Algoriphagus resistens TaxID=1750590 RepID=UPI000A5B7769|nr:cyclophilin-like fold protein [Algoriphagus resistens]
MFRKFKVNYSHTKLRTITILLLYGILSTTGMFYQGEEPRAQIVNDMESEAVQIEIIVGDQQFLANLNESETVRTFLTLLPMTVNMGDLNSNEKYIDLPQNLPQNASNPDAIQVGDLMLWGSRTLVIFYKSFSTSYPYTALGKLTNSDGLVQALGVGNVEVTFRVKTEY